MNRKYSKLYLFVFSVIFVAACHQTDRRKSINNHVINDSSAPEKIEGMAYIPSGNFIMGNESKYADPTEKPAHKVQLTGFYMDITEVNNAQFAEFVKETGYITVAEKTIDWETIKQQLPENTPPPPDSLLQPGALIFSPAKNIQDLSNISQWWVWKVGANWQHPQGPSSNIKGKENFPVVQIAFDDALAFAKWAGKRLPTEAEWEYASRGGNPNKRFAWGDELNPNGAFLANFYQGIFPDQNSAQDGYTGTAPVQSFPANEYGLYNMTGNVWEWTSDWYRADVHKISALINARGCVNPQGPDSSYDPDEPDVPKRVIKGGSFLCSAEYCSNYRPSARMAAAFDSGMEHLGFRCVKDL